MDLAWPAAIVLTLLLPGFVFFLGLYSRERFDRTSSSGEVSGKLAAIVFVSIFAHAVTLGIDRLLTHRFRPVPVPDFYLLLSAVSPSATGAARVSDLGTNISANLSWIVFYVLTATAIGWLAGWLLSGRIIAGQMRSLVRSAWLYEVWPQNKDSRITLAFVLSKIPKPPGFILYRGTLRRLGVSGDGLISFLVLDWPARCEVIKDDSGKTVNVTWKALGSSTENLQGGGTNTLARSFYVPVSESSNIVFERYRLWEGRLTRKDEKEIVNKTKDRPSGPVAAPKSQVG